MNLLTRIGYELCLHRNEIAIMACLRQSHTLCNSDAIYDTSVCKFEFQFLCLVLEFVYIMYHGLFNTHICLVFSPSIHLIVQKFVSF